MLPFTYCHDAGSTTVREGASILDDEGGKRSFAAIDSNVGGADIADLLVSSECTCRKSKSKFASAAPRVRQHRRFPHSGNSGTMRNISHKRHCRASGFVLEPDPVSDQGKGVLR